MQKPMLQNCKAKANLTKPRREKIQPVVQQKAPALAGAFTAVQTSLDKISGVAAEQADSAKQAVADSVAYKVENAKDAIGDAAQNAKDAVSEKATEVVDKSKEAVSNAAEKTKEATSDAVKNAADKIKNL